MKEKEIMELQKLMDDIREWSDATFGEGQRTVPILHHLKKEVDELIEEVMADLELESDSGTSLTEFADTFMLLFDAANHHGFTAANILNAVRGKLEINKKRKWGRPDENGVVEHIKEI